MKDLRRIPYFPGTDIPLVPEEYILPDAVLPPVTDLDSGSGLPDAPTPRPGPSALDVAPHLCHPPSEPQYDGQCCGLQNHEQCHSQISKEYYQRGTVKLGYYRNLYNEFSHTVKQFFS